MDYEKWEAWKKKQFMLINKFKLYKLSTLIWRWRLVSMNIKIDSITLASGAHGSETILNLFKGTRESNYMGMWITFPPLCDSICISFRIYCKVVRFVTFLTSETLSIFIEDVKEYQTTTKWPPEWTCNIFIMQTYPCHEYPLKAHFYIVKLGCTGVYFFSYFWSKT